MIFKMEFYGRRELTPSRKRSYLIMGVSEIAIGLFHGVKSDIYINSFSIIFTVGGILSIVFGIIGREIRKERNFISIGPDGMEFKNSYKKPQKVGLNDLLDLRPGNTTVEFVTTDQRVITYDFSVFQALELDKIYEQLGRIRNQLMNSHDQVIC